MVIHIINGHEVYQHFPSKAFQNIFLVCKLTIWQPCIAVYIRMYVHYWEVGTDLSRMAISFFVFGKVNCQCQNNIAFFFAFHKYQWNCEALTQFQKKANTFSKDNDPAFRTANCRKPNVNFFSRFLKTRLKFYIRARRRRFRIFWNKISCQ
jgi:hypothetical protein